MMEHRAASFWRNKTAASYVLHLVKQAVLFEFGATHPEMAHKDFALDMYERRLFTLPFAVTAFGFEAKPNNPFQASYAGTRPAGAMMVLSQDEDQRLTAIMCTEMRDEGGVSMGAIPFAIVMRAKLCDASGGAVSVDEESFSLIDDAMMATMLRRQRSNSARGGFLRHKRAGTRRYEAAGISLIANSVIEGEIAATI